MLKDRKHPVFSVLRLGYDALCQDEQHIFLDLALFFGLESEPGFNSTSEDLQMFDVWKWLSMIYRKAQDDIKESVKALRRKGLLDEVSEADELEIRIHDLYLDFAEAETRAGPFESRRFLLDKKGSDVPSGLLNNPSGSCWPSLKRLIICNSEVKSLKKAKLHLCSNVEVLVLVDCRRLKVVDVRGMKSLRCMVVTRCVKLGRRFEGVEKLSNLVFFSWLQKDWSGSSDFMIPMPPKFLHGLSSLRALEVLQMKGLCWSDEDIFPPDLRGCKRLRELTLSNLISESLVFRGAPDFRKLPKSLLEIDLSRCSVLGGSSPIRSMRSLKNLQSLDLEHCLEVNDLTGLSKLISLQKLNVSFTNISELPDLWELKQLEFLDVSNCDNLTSLIGIAHATALLDVNACGCQKLRELPDLRNLEQLEFLDVGGCEKLTSIIGIVHATALLHVDASRCQSLRELPDLRNLEQLQFLDVGGCEKLTSIIGIVHATALLHVDASRCQKLRELPDLRKLEQLEFLDVSSCEKLTSIIGIVHATALRCVYASWCRELRELPDNFSSMKKLEMLALSFDGSICTLPNDYERLVGRGILKVEGCWGLVVPLVKELQRHFPERSHADCVNSTGCISRCDHSIESWMDARKDVCHAAYDLLIDVFPSNYRRWSCFFDDGEGDDFLVRALCEHDDRGTLMLQSITAFGDDSAICVVVVATASCTFGLMTERAMLEPWDKTLLHYTIVKILPELLICEDQTGIRNGSSPFVAWAKLEASMAVLQKCKEQLQEAIGRGIDHARSMEGMEIAETFLREIDATDCQEISQSSIMWHEDSYVGSSYSEFFPNFPFGPILATEDCSR